ncbi:MAG: adenylosuccinate lyase [Candidatus Peregrinibacteria bacterium]|nr:adenylosuccinate lyase [Candidatus Peregrinibacteria bacterium]MDZ4245101.1 adenylosuccinate lyase [Candidatus Gracilibacteria bacterium]
MDQNLHSLFNLSPLDGRYNDKTRSLTSFFSEAALQRYRIITEVEWLIFMCNSVQYVENAGSEPKRLEGTRELSEKEIDLLQKLYIEFDETAAAHIKDIEKTTNHDVKAVEYFMKEKLKKSSLKDVLEFIHFGCTSEDINNLCHAMMLRDSIEEVIVPTLFMLNMNLKALAAEHKAVPMLSRTHGQSATPTTVGKELIVFVARLERQLSQLLNSSYLGKFNGAVGNYNAHLSAYPDWDWATIGEGFIEHLNLTPNLFTTQIENHDYMAEIFDNIRRINTILIDLDRDIWNYVSLGYFTQKSVKGEVGSSTMPHKVNPIDFENSEGNLGLANAVLGHLSEKLPISRMQRDLTDSTVLRNMGVAFGYSLIAFESTIKGLGKLEINKGALARDLDSHWEVLAEPIQTVMRRYGIEKPYEKLKEFTRGKKVDQKSFEKFIDGLKDLPASERTRLKKMSPMNYIGEAVQLVDMYISGGMEDGSGCGGGGCCCDAGNHSLRGGSYVYT